MPSWELTASAALWNPVALSSSLAFTRHVAPPPPPPPFLILSTRRVDRSAVAPGGGERGRERGGAGARDVDDVRVPSGPPGWVEFTFILIHDECTTNVLLIHDCY